MSETQPDQTGLQNAHGEGSQHSECEFEVEITMKPKAMLMHTVYVKGTEIKYK